MNLKQEAMEFLQKKSQIMRPKPTKQHFHYPEIPEMQPCPICKKQGFIRTWRYREGDILHEQVKALSCKQHGDYIILHGMPPITLQSNYAQSYRI